MKIAESSRQKLETFFREHTGDADFRLPSVRFYAGGLTGVLTNLIGVHGITFGRRIFIKPIIVSKNRNLAPQMPPNLAAHEIAHVLQYQKFGFIGFFRRYLADYYHNLRKSDRRDAEAKHAAYLAIPFEIEARAVGAAFVEWREKNKSNADTDFSS